jgi:methyl-accepting chemotaxis protein
LSLAVDVHESHSLIFFIYIKTDTSQTEAEKAQINQMFLLGKLIVAAIISAAIFIVFNNLILRHLHQVVDACRWFQKGDLAARTNVVKANNELGALQRGVNSMSAQLQDIVEDRTCELEKSRQ